MVKPESPGQKRETHEKKPVSKVDLQNNIDAKIRAEAEKMLSDAGFLAKLSAENISRFIKDHSAKNYQNYHEWNEDFCKSVLSLDKTRPAEQIIRVMALQFFLHDKIGGFTGKPGSIDSFDGKLGRFTLVKLEEYFKRITPSARRPEAPGPDKEVAGKLTEKFDPRHVRYAGDSYMEGLLAGQKIDPRYMRALKSSHLVRTKMFDTKKYRENHYFVEEEAMKYIKDPECRLLVLGGGGNDLNARYPISKVIDEIKKCYGALVNEAHKRGIKVAIYALNTETAPKGRSERKTQLLRKAALEINEWLVKESGAGMILDATQIISGRLRADGLHPTARANRDLYAALKDTAIKTT